MYAAAFAASLPLVQAHAYIGLALVIGIFFVLDFHKWIAVRVAHLAWCCRVPERCVQDMRLFMSWALAGVVAVAVGYPQMALFQVQ
jgi:hypothetical protein